MRRLSILKRFANSRKMEFDIENMEISMLTKPKDEENAFTKKQKSYLEHTEFERALIKKQANYEEIMEELDPGYFIQYEDRIQMDRVVELSKEEMEAVTL